MAGNIVHLIGSPGVGKLTIARKIIRQRPDFVLADNHLINNPVFSVVKADGKTPLPAEIWAKTSQIRAIVLDTMATLSPSHLSFVMTNVAKRMRKTRPNAARLRRSPSKAAVSIFRLF
jgi:hypothetical protein